MVIQTNQGSQCIGAETFATSRPRGNETCAFCLETKQFSPLYAGRFTKVRSLADSDHGKILLCRMHTQGQDDQVVMVKKIANRFLNVAQTGVHRGVSDPKVEIAALMKLAASPSKCKFLIDLVDVAHDNIHTMVAMKHCNEGPLFDVICRDESSSEAKVRRFAWQLLQAINHLHSNNIGHLNVSIEAIFVDDGELRLTDFGQAVQLGSSGEDHERGLYVKYSHICGSRYYRAPECYPKLAPHDDDPACLYEAQPVDVFSCGVVLFVLHARCAPWKLALPCDARFVLSRDRGVGQLLPSRPLTEGGMALLAGMLQPEPASRPSVEQALSSPWFDVV